MRIAAIALGFAALAQALVACEATHVFVAHETVVGVDAAVDTQMTKGHLIIGYDRNFVAVIPKSVNTTDGPPGGRDAMSVVACSNVKVDGIVLTQFTENMATGKAARIYAQRMSSESGKQLFRCLDKPADGAGN